MDESERRSSHGRRERTAASLLLGGLLMGESSQDGGQTWTCETEVFARRKPARPPS